MRQKPEEELGFQPMGESSNPTVAEILSKLRARIRARSNSSPSPSATAPLVADPAISTVASARQYLAAAQTWQNQVGQINPRPPGLHNDLIQVVKKILRRMLTWYTRPIVGYQAAVTQSLTEMTRYLESHRSEVAASQERTEALGRDLATIQGTLHADLVRLQETLERLEQSQLETAGRTQHVSAQLQKLEAQISLTSQKLQSWEEAQLLERLRLAERDLRRLRRNHKAPTAAPRDTAPHRASAKAARELDYFWLQERFRGDEAEIKRKQEIYVPYFEGKKHVVDLGCGRGEFLELMRAHGIPAQGVELNPDMALLCKEKKLDVVHGDLFSYLARFRPQSLEGIFCAQVIEHLDNEQLLALIRLAREKLRPQGVLVLETVNPACLMVFASSLYMDPTHHRPIHPETLKFLLESMDFSSVELVYLAPVECRLPSLDWPGLTPEQRDELKRSINLLNQVFFGYRDYSAVAWKPGK